MCNFYAHCAGPYWEREYGQWSVFVSKIVSVTQENLFVRDVKVIVKMVMYGTKRIYGGSDGPYQRPYKQFRPYTKYNRFTQAARSINKFTTPGPSKKGTLTAQVRSLQKVVAQLKPELKALDVTIDQSDMSSSGTVVPIHLVSQGDTQGQRTGNVINVKNIDIGFHLTRTAAMTGQSLNQFFRWALVVDKEQISDGIPGAGDIFETPGAPYLDHVSLVHLERFRFLYVSPCIDLNQMVMWTTSNSLVGVPTKANVYGYSWSGEIKVAFNGTASTDIEKNGIFIVLLNSGSNAQSDLVGKARLCFTDV